MTKDGKKRKREREGGREREAGRGEHTNTHKSAKISPVFKKVLQIRLGM